MLLRGQPTRTVGTVPRPCRDILRADAVNVSFVDASAAGSSRPSGDKSLAPSFPCVNSGCNTTNTSISRGTSIRNLGTPQQVLSRFYSTSLSSSYKTAIALKVKNQING
jgi:hypothetical protein